MVTSRPTLGSVLESGGMIPDIEASTRMIISKSVEAAEAVRGRHLLPVISCHGCTAHKACCHLVTYVHLYEGIPIAHRLRREGRDTPSLRGALRVSAEAMENTNRLQYEKPCVFLDAAERCTIYEERPQTCGSHLVFSPAEMCSGTTKIDVFDARQAGEMAMLLDEKVRARVGLAVVNARTVLRVRVLPRMVLLCLQAWDRTDYAHFIEQAESRLPTLSIEKLESNAF